MVGSISFFWILQDELLPSSRACFNVQWCTKCEVMNENVQWWKAVFAVMNCERNREIRGDAVESWRKAGKVLLFIHGRWLKKGHQNFWGMKLKFSPDCGYKKSGRKCFGGNLQWWIFLKTCSALFWELWSIQYKYRYVDSERIMMRNGVELSKAMTHMATVHSVRMWI